MQAQVTWSELWTVVTVGLALGGIVVGIVLWLWTKHSAHDRELADFKIKAAETYVTLAALSQMEQRHAQAMDRLSDSMGRLSDRVERALEKVAQVAAHG